jgi:hypothetical protein
MSSEGPQPPYDPSGDDPGQPDPGQPYPGQPYPGQSAGWGGPPPGGPPPGGYPGGPQYAPPPNDPYAHLRREHPKATTALVLGIVGLVLCGLAAPFAWRIGKNAVDEIDASQGILGGRGQAQAGYILGLIGTILLGLGLVLLLFFLFIGLAAGFSSTG